MFVPTMMRTRRAFTIEPVTIVSVALVCFMILLLMPAVSTGASADQDGVIEEVLVIGSRSAPRSALDSPSPVDVFQAEDLQRTGFLGGELGEALQMVAPSFNFPRQSNSGTSDHIRAGQLRGMSPDQMLVLINGKRRHPSAVVNTETKIGRGTAAVDFNTIPLEAVSRVEILRDGAGAQYGSDAIAGVVNLILDDRPRGFEVTASYGEHVTHEDAIDESFTDGETLSVSATGGFSVGEGFLRLGVSWLDRQQTNRAGFDQIPFFVPQTPPNLALQGQRNYAEGDPDVDQTQFWFNGELPLGAVTLYAFGTASFRETEGDTFFRYPDDSRNVPTIHPNGFLPTSTGDDDDAALTVGMSGLWRSWELDGSVTVGGNEFSYGVENSVNASLGPESPTEFDSGSYEFTQVVTNLNAVRSFEGAAGSRRGGRALASRAPSRTPFWRSYDGAVAVGVEHRHERFESSAGEPASFRAGPFDGDIGAQGAPGLTPADTAKDRRDVLAAYVDVSSQLGDRLFASVAGRAERYSDFGDVYTGKLSAIFDVTDRLALRGTVSSNLRAPSLSQINFADRTLNFGENRTLVNTVTLRPGDPLAPLLGVESLDEETARNVSLGMTAQPAEGWTLTIDAFDIRVDDRITLSERLFGSEIEALIAAAAPERGSIESVR
jgi:iron complex outermembrane receptor protein